MDTVWEHNGVLRVVLWPSRYSLRSRWRSSTSTIKILRTEIWSRKMSSWPAIRPLTKWRYAGLSAQDNGRLSLHTDQIKCDYCNWARHGSLWVTGLVVLSQISDFGMSKLMTSKSCLKTFCGTPSYLAPEILHSMGDGMYTKAVDCWSLGVLLFLLYVKLMQIIISKILRELKYPRYFKKIIPEYCGTNFS